MKKIELLAPAGNIEKLRFAFAYGADAAYLGLNRFSLRDKADNFSYDDLEKAILYAKELNKKIANNKKRTSRSCIYRAIQNPQGKSKEATFNAIIIFLN